MLLACKNYGFFEASTRQSYTGCIIKYLLNFLDRHHLLTHNYPIEGSIAPASKVFIIVAYARSPVIKSRMLVPL